MNSRIDQHTSHALVFIAASGWKVVDSPSFNVNASNFGVVMSGKDGKLDGAAPCGWFENRGNVF
jgi:hypothetical protein